MHYLKTYGLLLFAALSSCEGRKQVSLPKTAAIQAPAADSPAAVPPKPPTLRESFSDSLELGQKGLTKVDMEQYQSRDTGFVILRFYRKQQGKWKLSNEFSFEKDDISSCDPKISDFNHDGLKDFTYVSTTAARSANEVRRLFIYDPAKDRFVYIINSEEYPNMQYNARLDCIDAFMVHGGTGTHFLKLKGNQLKPFARVSSDNYRYIYRIGPDGRETLLRKDSIGDVGVYVRYKNFDPLEAYE